MRFIRRPPYQCFLSLGPHLEKEFALKNRKISFLLLSDNHGRVRKWNMSSLFVFPAVALCIIIAAGLYGILSDYFEIRGQAHLIVALMEKNERHEEQQAYLSARLEKISEKLERLREQEKKLRTLANLKVEDDTSKVMGMGGSESDTAMDVAKEEPLMSPVTRIEEKRVQHPNGLERAPAPSMNEDHLARQQNDFYPLLPFRPYEMPYPGWVYAGFGSRSSPLSGEPEFNKGIEIATKMNTPVRVPADGVVLYVGEDHRYGKIIVIEHGYGFITRYGRLGEILVREGEKVPSGKAIAHVGERKTTIGPTLHYEVMLGGIPVNPLRYPLG
jgi:murein DD-endopeptidase MepM/ murein hydrolase activator NlpD